MLARSRELDLWVSEGTAREDMMLVKTIDVSHVLYSSRECAFQSVLMLGNEEVIAVVMH